MDKKEYIVEIIRRGFVIGSVDAASTKSQSP